MRPRRTTAIPRQLRPGPDELRCEPRSRGACRILFLAANPEETQRLNIELEFREIKDALRRADIDGCFELYSEWALRPDDLQEHLLRYQPTIVHFSGHAVAPRPLPRASRDLSAPLALRPSEQLVSPATSLIVRSPERGAVGLPVDALAGLLARQGSIRCVVLNACHTLAQAHAIARGVDVVIGMAREIDDEAAIVFSRAFYRALAFGESVGAAFSLARNSVQLQGLPDATVPRCLVDRPGVSASALVLTDHGEERDALDTMISGRARQMPPRHDVRALNGQETSWSAPWSAFAGPRRVPPWPPFFLRGGPPAPADIAFGDAYPRLCALRLARFFSSGGWERPRWGVMLGRAGDGKTTAALLVARALFERGYQVLWSRGADQPLPRELHGRIEKRPALLVVDDARGSTAWFQALDEQLHELAETTGAPVELLLVDPPLDRLREELHTLLDRLRRERPVSLLEVDAAPSSDELDPRRLDAHARSVAESRGRAYQSASYQTLARARRRSAARRGALRIALRTLDEDAPPHDSRPAWLNEEVKRWVMALASIDLDLPWTLVRASAGDGAIIAETGRSEPIEWDEEGLRVSVGATTRGDAEALLELHAFALEHGAGRFCGALTRSCAGDPEYRSAVASVTWSALNGRLEIPREALVSQLVAAFGALSQAELDDALVDRACGLLESGELARDSRAEVVSLLSRAVGGSLDVSIEADSLRAEDRIERNRRCVELLDVRRRSDDYPPSTRWAWAQALASARGFAARAGDDREFARLSATVTSIRRRGARSLRELLELAELEACARLLRSGERRLCEQQLDEFRRAGDPSEFGETVRAQLAATLSELALAPGRSGPLWKLDVWDELLRTLSDGSAPSETDVHARWAERLYLIHLERARSGRAGADEASELDSLLARVPESRRVRFQVVGARVNSHLAALLRDDVAEARQHLRRLEELVPARGDQGLDARLAVALYNAHRHACVHRAEDNARALLSRLRALARIREVHGRVRSLIVEATENNELSFTGAGERPLDVADTVAALETGRGGGETPGQINPWRALSSARWIDARTRTPGAPTESRGRASVTDLPSHATASRRALEPIQTAASSSAPGQFDPARYTAFDVARGALRRDDEHQLMVIGRGGLGRVLAAYDRRLGRPVAIKESVTVDENAEANRRFLREARVTARLQHPSIVSVYDLGLHEDGRPYYTMKLVRGRTLAEAISACSDLEERLRLLDHFTDLCQALAYAHSQGVVHRDIKPANVMVGEFGETLLLDWGLAKLGEETSSSSALERPGGEFSSLPGLTDGSQTVAGSVLGTPAYMSPEQAAGELELIDARSDTWSLGCVLYELLTGQRAFSGRDVSKRTQSANLSTRVRASCPKIPADLAAIVTRALQRERSRRYEDAGALARDIEAFRSGDLVNAHDYSSWERLRRFSEQHSGALLASVGALLLLLIVGGVAATMVAAEGRRARLAERVSIAAQRDAERQRADALALLAESLVAQATTAWHRGETSTAWLFAAKALTLGERADARGIVLGTARSWTPRYAGAFELPIECSHFLKGPENKRFACRGLHQLALWESNGSSRVLELPARSKAEVGARPEIVAAAVSSLGRRIAISQTGPRLGIYDIDTDRWVAQLSIESERPVTGLMYSVDGDAIYGFVQRDAAGSELAAWRVADGERRVAPLRLPANGIAVAPDGTALAVTDSRGVLFIDPRTLVVIGRRRMDGTVFHGPRFAPDSSAVAVNSQDGDTWIVPRDASEPVDRIPGSGGAGRLDWSPDGSMLADSRANGRVRLIDLELAREVFVIPEERSGDAWAVFAPATGELIVPVAPAVVRSWSLPDERPPELYELAPTRSLPRASAPTSVETTIRDPAPEKHVGRDIWKSERPRELRLSPDGLLAVTFPPARMGIVETWRVTDGARLARVAHAGRSADLAVDGSLVLLRGDNLAIADAWTGETRAEFPAPGLRAARWLGAGETILGLTEDNELLVFDARSGERVLSDAGHSERLLPTLDPETVLMWEERSGRLQSWSVLHGSPRPLLTVDDGVLALQPSPRGRVVVASLGDGELAVIDAELGVLVNRWRAHDERLPSVGVSEDGALVATATADHVVNLWDTDAQLLRARFPRHAQRVTSLHFSEAARILLSLDHDGRLQPWDLDRLHQGADQLLSEAERRFGCRVDDSRIDPVVEVRGPLRVRAP